MANARKCDRCGGFFDPIHLEDGMICRFRNPMFQNENDVREGLIGKLMLNSNPDAYVDLCPECSEMFEAFMCGGEPAWCDYKVMCDKNLELEKSIGRLTTEKDILEKENLGFRKEVERLMYDNNFLKTENEILGKYRNQKPVKGAKKNE